MIAAATIQLTLRRRSLSFVVRLFRTHHVKTRLILGLLFVLLGTNVFTYATTRYTTTKQVLTHARSRMDAALNQEGLYEEVYPPGRPRSYFLMSAISGAGGMYYWWNDALVYWGVASVLASTGVLLPFVRSATRERV